MFDITEIKQAPPIDPAEELLEAQAWGCKTVQEFYDLMEEAYAEAGGMIPDCHEWFDD